MLISGQNFDTRALNTYDEAIVRSQLSSIRELVCRKSGDKLVYQLPPTAQKEQVVLEIARRLQALNTAWKITGMVYAHNITMERRTVSADLEPENAGAFYIDIARRQMLEENGAAIDEAITTVQRHVNASGRKPQNFEVPFPSTVSFYVLDRAADRMNYYSTNFSVRADSEKHAIIGSILFL